MSFIWTNKSSEDDNIKRNMESISPNPTKLLFGSSNYPTQYISITHQQTFFHSYLNICHKTNEYNLKKKLFIT